MKQKSYQKISTVATVVAVAATLVLVALKWCGLFAFSWWWVFAPFLLVSAFWLGCMLFLMWFFWWGAKQLDNN